MKEATITTQTRPVPVTALEFQRLAQAHLDGIASDADLADLAANEEDWTAALRALHRDVNETLDRLRREVRGPERALVLEDFEAERDRIEQALATLVEEPEAAEPETAPEAEEPAAPAEDEAPGPEVREPQLQLSWNRGQIIAWVAGVEGEPGSEEDVRARLSEAGAGERWEAGDRVLLPGGRGRARSVTAPVAQTLGWLVSLGTTGDDDQVAPSMTWLGLAAGLAVRLVAQGRMAPQLQKVGDAPGNRSFFAVRWEPTLIDADELQRFADSMPGAVRVLDRRRDTVVITRSIVGSFVDAICRDAAGRLEVPAPPPHPQSASEVAETVLARLNGSEFEAPHQQGTEIRKGLRTWASGITGATRFALTVQLDPPDEGDAWLLRTLTSDGKRTDEPIEAAMSRANHERKERLKRELERLEGLYHPLQRGKDTRRGQVILSQDEAWDLMTTTGEILTAAGFEVRVPPLSRKKATPSLRITSVGEQAKAVGAQQLSDVRWSAVFDDVELTAAQIRELAGESRPLVRSHGRWVEVSHADLEAAAKALEERAKQTKLSGADMLRYALGLESSGLGGAVSVAGDSWAANLLRSAGSIPQQPPTSPEGFEGELRSYQANALAWLDFLDDAGLGGCLALDMGLGKTPTMLAHLAQSTQHGTALVIAPPAVVGNWAAEAQRFTPQLEVYVHHGQHRVDEAELADQLADVDVLITTYGTAVRDIEAISEIAWGKVVLDEAQVIKNPTSETAQQLRRLQARTRMVLTGTPIENGLGDLWALMDFVNPGLLGERNPFIAQMQAAAEKGDTAESALKTLNGVLVFRRTKAEPVIAQELPDRIDALDHCPMTTEQIGLYQAVLDELVIDTADHEDAPKKKGAILAAITALKQICNHPAAYTGDDGPLENRSGKLARLEEIVGNVFESGERMLIFTHFATWGERLATHLTERFGIPIDCYHGGLARGARDRMIERFQGGEGPGALVLSLKAGGTGLNLTAASHVVLYDRWWNPAVEDQARDRVWRIGQTRTVVAHRLVCPGTVDERVEEVVSGKRRIADLALPKSSSVGDLDSEQLRQALGIDPDLLLTDDVDANGVRTVTPPDDAPADQAAMALDGPATDDEEGDAA
ncbi:MAG: DEAD/DEAH box helicase [Nitriliruptoraceae bacterium]|nr:DEAD/DEAH box helicase [Nitriliruptoraceae bacterium]